MIGLRTYILGVVCAAIVCAVIKTLLHKQNSANMLIKFVLGVFMTVTVISPISKIQFNEPSDYFDDIQSNAKDVVNEGVEHAHKQLAQIIKQRSEAYVLDKAASLGLEVEVEVTLSSSDPPMPQSVAIKGAVSPYTKERLSDYITAGLDVPKDEQVWI